VVLHSANIVEMSQQCEDASTLLVIPHLDKSQQREPHRVEDNSNSGWCRDARGGVAVSRVGTKSARVCGAALRGFSHLDFVVITARAKDRLARVEVDAADGACSGRHEYRASATKTIVQYCVMQSVARCRFLSGPFAGGAMPSMPPRPPRPAPGAGIVWLGGHHRAGREAGRSPSCSSNRSSSVPIRKSHSWIKPLWRDASSLWRVTRTR